ncbi:hypothetical protein XACG102_10930005 [Xanthomonas citri pv. citri]|nr:hypothetical protein XACG102_10930005 [Xanthomonas citri pv. citri]
MRKSTQLELAFLLHYGPLIPASRLVNLLGFDSYQALDIARRRNGLPFTGLRIPGRRGWFARTGDVCAWIESVSEYTAGQGGSEEGGRA